MPPPPPSPPPQGELQLLCMQLDRHISTHIRESPQAMHRTKLKDLATQTYIRWQDLLTHCQPQVVSHNPPDLGGKGSGQSEQGLADPAVHPPPLQLLGSKGRGWSGQCGGGWGCLGGPSFLIQGPGRECRGNTGRSVADQMQRKAALEN